MDEVYLDNSATTRVCPESAQKVLSMMTERYGNPSSLHTMGLDAQREVDEARAAIAARLGAQPREVTFTSGGTESNNLAVFGAAEAGKRRGKRIVTTALEHPSVLEPMLQLEKQGYEVLFLPPGKDGVVAKEALFEAINRETILVSVMAVNNELGSVQPVEELKKAVKRAGAPALVHVDAVQAFGKLPLKPSRLGIDLMTVSAHKIHGPKGVGALFVDRNARILPRAFGGGQEKSLRPGTEASPLIAGFGAAVQALPESKEALQAMRELRDYAVDRLSEVEGVVMNSRPEALPYLVNFSALGVRSETMLHFLAAKGIYVSSGSACAKGRLSHVLEAVGLPEKRIVSAIRASFSRYNTREDVDRLIEGIQEGLKSLVKAI